MSLAPSERTCDRHGPVRSLAEAARVRGVARMHGRKITLGAGEHGLALAVDADEILQALNASVADISDPEPAT